MDQNQQRQPTMLEMLIRNALERGPQYDTAPQPPPQGVLPPNGQTNMFGQPVDDSLVSNNSAFDQIAQQLEEQRQRANQSFGMERRSIAGQQALLNALPAQIRGGPMHEDQPYVTSGAFQLAGGSPSIIPAPLPRSGPPVAPPPAMPANTGIEWPLPAPAGPLPDFHNSHPAPFPTPPAPNLPAHAAPMPSPQTPPGGADALVAQALQAAGVVGGGANGPVLVPAQGGSPNINLPFRPLNPAERAPGPSPGDLLNVQQREANAGFPTPLIPVPDRPAVLNLPQGAPQPSPAAAPPALAPPRTMIGPAPTQAGPVPNRVPAPDDNAVTQQLNEAERDRVRRELDLFSGMQTPISTAPPSPNLPASGTGVRTAPPPAPMPPGTPPTVLPSGEGVSQPKMGQMPEHLKDALLQEALRISRGRRAGVPA